MANNKDRLQFRPPIDDAELDFADCEDRYFNKHDYPDDYVGSSTSDYLIVELDGLRCVVKIEVPDPDGKGGRRARLIRDVIETLNTP